MTRVTKLNSYKALDPAPPPLNLIPFAYRQLYKVLVSIYRRFFRSLPAEESESTSDAASPTPSAATSPVLGPLRLHPRARAACDAGRRLVEAQRQVNLGCQT